MRTCPFNDCGEPIKAGMFACRKHWYSLSRPQQDEIWAAYNAYCDGKIDLDELRRRQQAVLDATKVGGHV